MRDTVKNDKADVVQRVLAALVSGDAKSAQDTASTEYPHSLLANSGRKYNADQMTAIFIRDGFIDRYSGARLVFPGALRLLSQLLPDEFPFHKNWKMSECHVMFWELYPTIDHVVPVARGGSDTESNWVTTSMLRNSAKSNWLLSELGWEIVPPGDSNTWDGLLNAFIAYVLENKDLLPDPYIRRWYNAAVKAKFNGGESLTNPGPT